MPTPPGIKPKAPGDRRPASTGWRFGSHIHHL